MPATHEVLNQPTPLVGHDVFAGDAALAEGVTRLVPDALDGLHDLGRLAGTAEAQDWGRLANEHPPILRTFDRYGNRIDEVEYHPAYHQLMGVAVSRGLHAAPWRRPDPATGEGPFGPMAVGSHVARAAAFHVWSQVEAGHGCPISMTYAVVPALRAQAELADVWEARFTSNTYEPGTRPAPERAGCLAGMAMTEKQGGSDVRANTTRAHPLGERGPGQPHELVGHKFFCSAPMSDGWLMLAQAPGGLSCFLVPKWRPDGTRNPVHVMRLKDKLGNRSNASSEIEIDEALGWMVGEEGRGVRTIITMVNTPGSTARSGRCRACGRR